MKYGRTVIAILVLIMPMIGVMFFAGQPNPRIHNRDNNDSTVYFRSASAALVLHSQQIREKVIQVSREDLRQQPALTPGRENIPTSRGQAEHLEYIGEFTATAYTHTGRQTATGIWPHKGIIAVDPKIIPLGSRVYVEGYGYALAADTGGAIKGQRIDLFYETYGEAIQWGRRPVKLYILGG